MRKFQSITEHIQPPAGLEAEFWKDVEKSIDLIRTVHARNDGVFRRQIRDATKSLAQTRQLIAYLDTLEPRPVMLAALDRVQAKLDQKERSLKVRHSGVRQSKSKKVWACTCALGLLMDYTDEAPTTSTAGTWALLSSELLLLATGKRSWDMGRVCQQLRKKLRGI